MKRVGVDIGGTFTDLVVYDEKTGAIAKTKALTSARSPEQGLLLACSQAAIDAAEVTTFMHGTTLVTNLVLTRTGAKVGLITTKGFRDVLEIGRSYRNELYNLEWDKPVPFVPRYLVREVSERVDHKGTVLVPLAREEVADAIQSLLAEGIESVAVCFLNAYAEAAHERLAGEVIRQIAPHLFLTLSSEIDPRIREYQRVSTTVLNAYAMPKTHGYIERLDRAVGIGVKYMHSGGGIIPAAVAAKMPIALVNSGPSAGVLAGKFIGERVGIPNLITADVGGTSFDVCVIRNGRPDMKDEVEVEWGIPARTQSIDVNSIGTGGGSIAWIDEGGVLRVGPQSATADPGPACYGLGGTQPTVTDANMVLGILNPDNFLGGKLRLDPGASWKAIEPIAAHFGVSVPEAAAGIYRIGNVHMAQAIVESTVKKGIDPRDFTLVAFGGAGGQHAVEVAREVGIPSVLVPLNPSTFSAFGLLTADLKNTVSRTVLMPLDRLNVDALRVVFRDLETEATRFMAGEERLMTRVSTEYFLDVRYIGQSNEVAVLLPANWLRRDAIYKEFERLHSLLYGTRLSDPAEIVNVRVTVTGIVRPIELAVRRKAPSFRRATAKARRKVAFFPKPIAVFDRDDLDYGMTLREPCILEEVDHTLFVPKGCTVRVDRYRNLFIELPRGARGRIEKLWD